MLIFQLHKQGALDALLSARSWEKTSEMIYLFWGGIKGRRNYEEGLVKNDSCCTASSQLLSFLQSGPVREIPAIFDIF